MIGILFALVCNVSEPAFPAREFSIVDYGAKPEAKCTEAFDRAFAACAAAGGGRIIVPDGKWLTGGIRFRSNCDLHLADGATVEFADDLEDRLPAVHTSWEGVECLNWSPLVYAYDVTNVAITGGGTFAPRMDRWREWAGRPPSHQAATELLYHWCSTNAPLAVRDLTKVPGSQMRPHLIQFNRAKGVLLDGFRIREAPFWTIHLYHSENCIVRNLDVYAHGHNNDGVDVEMTKDVLIENCTFDQGDDGVVLKAGRNQDAWRLNRPTENVEVRNCRLVNGHTLLGLGSELSGGIRNVHLTDCTVSDVYRILFVKTNRRRGGFVENVVLENVTADSAWRVFGLDMDTVYQWKRFPDYEIRLTRIDGITMRNVRCKRSSRLEPAFEISGDARMKPRNLRFENVSVGEADGELFKVANADGVSFENVRSEVPAPPKSTADRVLAEVRAWDLEADEGWRRLKDRADYDNHRHHLANRMRAVFGNLPERTPLKAQVTGIVQRDGYRVEKVMFESRPHYHVTGHLFLPDSAKFASPYRAVLIVCGHSDDGKLSGTYQNAAVECAKAGFATFIIDPVDQGERGQLGKGPRSRSVWGHNLAGSRAMLLGEEFAFWRIWDAVRAIDYLYTRREVRKDGVGVMGNSGGGTMTSWMRAVDDRVKASAATCYISTLRDVCESIGPQDAEQQIYGELRIGLNHAGMQLVRDAPGLICCKWRDFFPYSGSVETLGVMTEVGMRIGRLDNWAMCDADGPHGWVPSTIEGSILWMRAHLRGESGVLPLDLPALRKMDPASGHGVSPDADKGLNGRPDALVTPTGQVVDLPGEKTIYDLLDEKLAEVERTRPRLAGEELAACVRQLAGIRLPEAVVEPDVPFDLYRPERETAAPVLIVADCGRTNAAVVARAEAAKAAGSLVMVADVAGFGELGEMRHDFYGSPRPEEGTAVMLYILGESLVGRRATDILASAAYLKGLSGKPVTLVASRTAVIPAAHAFAADRGVFGATEFDERPESWSSQLRGREPIGYCDCVYGALLHYDWTDLL